MRPRTRRPATRGGRRERHGAPLLGGRVGSPSWGTVVGVGHGATLFGGCVASFLVRRNVDAECPAISACRFFGIVCLGDLFRGRRVMQRHLFARFGISEAILNA